ncbi:hypothetical protein CASFOL_018228 [Castilleja foliolosa]|uniref:Single-stranded DNA binding protein Ssb-like OB fold domain-containing protein n=1 Tax=Castilleja foliolosa TaxID=1961234 RepID=A0ABD3DA48_9LAMI
MASAKKSWLRKPVFVKVDALKSCTNGHTLVVKAVSANTVLNKKPRNSTFKGAQARNTKTAKFIIGDENGTILFTSRNEQVYDGGPTLTKDDYCTSCIFEMGRNMQRANMVRSFLRFLDERKPTSGATYSSQKQDDLLEYLYKEYQLHYYSSWFLKQLAKLSPIEAGCCRPPSECGYPAVNTSFKDLSFHPISSNKDCRLYKNSKAIKCYNCDSCKAGVAEYMKIEWSVVAIFNVILVVVLTMVCFVGCCARRNATTINYKV